MLVFFLFPQLTGVIHMSRMHWMDGSGLPLFVQLWPIRSTLRVAWANQNSTDNFRAKNQKSGHHVWPTDKSIATPGNTGGFRKKIITLRSNGSGSLMTRDSRCCQKRQIKCLWMLNLCNWKRDGNVSLLQITWRKFTKKVTQWRWCTARSTGQTSGPWKVAYRTHSLTTY